MIEAAVLSYRAGVKQYRALQSSTGPLQEMRDLRRALAQERSLTSVSVLAAYCVRSLFKSPNRVHPKPVSSASTSLLGLESCSPIFSSARRSLEEREKTHPSPPPCRQRLQAS